MQELFFYAKIIYYKKHSAYSDIRRPFVFTLSYKNTVTVFVSVIFGTSRFRSPGVDGRFYARTVRRMLGNTDKDCAKTYICRHE